MQTAASAPAPAKFVLLAPLRLVNGSPASFQYAGNPAGICLPGSLPSPTPTPGHGDDGHNNDNGNQGRGNDSHAVSVRSDEHGDEHGDDGSKHGPVVKPRQTETLTVGAFTLLTACTNVTPSPSPSPTPVPTPRTRSAGRSTATVVFPTPTATPTAPPATTTSYYVVAINLANPASPTIASGPAALASNSLNFSAAAAPLTLSGGQSYTFALASRIDTVPVPSDTPSPSPTDTPSPVPTDTPTPGPTDTPTPTPTISPCPGAVATSEGTYCSWAVPHPPVDMTYDNPNLAYSSSAGAFGRFDVNLHTSREQALPGTPFTVMAGSIGAGNYGQFVGISSPSNNLAFSADVGGITLFTPPPSVPALPHNIATALCSGQPGSCDDVAIANGDVILYNPATSSIDLDIALTSPAASASAIVQSYASSPFDILALTPDRHIVYATIDQNGGSLVEHVLPDVLPAGYRFTGLARNTDGVHFTASDYQLGSAPQGHGLHEIIDYTTFASRSIPFGTSGETCDAMGITIGTGRTGTYYISCANAIREYLVGSNNPYTVALVPADGALLYQPAGGGGYVELFATSYQASSIIELQVSKFYPGITPSAAKRRAAVSAKHH